jgi:flavorubredoxin
MTTLLTPPERTYQSQPIFAPSPFAAPAPAFRHEPQKIAEDTYLIRSTFGEGEAPVFVYVNSMVITGREAVVVDTGTANNRRQWMDDVMSLVNPENVRYVFISHDDHDHTGNIEEALLAFPNATLITTWFQIERLAGDYRFPLNRMRWVEDGETVELADRKLTAVRPPVFDSPTTRGLYDPKTGVFWASDAFATLMPQAVDNVDELHPEEWRQGFSGTNLALSPWVSMVDETKYAGAIKKIRDLDPQVIASAHTPVITGQYVGAAIDMLHDLPAAPAPALPTQKDLDAILAGLAQGGH